MLGIIPPRADNDPRVEKDEEAFLRKQESNGIARRI
jgi:hypothetical protein